MSVWDQLVGQSAATETLQRAAALARTVDAARSDAAGSDAAGNPNPAQQPSGNMAHSWLFTGPPGSGRSVAARCFAAALQCTGEQPGCGTCEGCRTTMAGTNADVKVAATEKLIINIEEARELLAIAQTSPLKGQWRIVIVEDADRMAERTTNVLLKSLEEPPERTIWMLCAPTPEDLLTTIRSRCRHVQLSTPAASEVAGLLVQTEGIEPEYALQMAQIAQSHIGVARALVRDPQLRAQRVEQFQKVLGAGSVGQAVTFAAELLDSAKDQAAQASAVRDSAEKAELLAAMGVDENERLAPSQRAQVRELEADQKRREKRSLNDALDRVLLDVLSFFRDVLMVQNGATTSLINVDLEAQVQQWANGSTVAQTLERIRATEQARTRLQTNMAVPLLLEALLISIQRA